MYSKNKPAGGPERNTSTVLHVRTLTAPGEEGRPRLSNFGSRILTKARDKKTRFCALVSEFVFHMDNILELYAQTKKARGMLWVRAGRVQLVC